MSVSELNKFLNNRCWSEISKDEIRHYLTDDRKLNVCSISQFRMIPIFHGGQRG